MNILVSGANGFIGRHVCHILIDRGHKVIGLTRSKTAQHDQAIQWIVQDINLDQSAEKFKKHQIDAFIHLAWPDLENYRASCHLTHHLVHHYSFLKSLLNIGILKLQIIGTCLEYGMQSGCLNETMQAKPNLPYALAKHTLHQKILATMQTHHKAATLQWVRLFYLYGEDQRPSSFVPLLRKAIANQLTSFPMSWGQQIRDYLPVKTVAQSLSRLIEKTNSGTFNCSSNQPIRLLDLANKIIHDANSPIQLKLGVYPYPDYEPMEFWGNNTKLLSAIGETSLATFDDNI